MASAILMKKPDRHLGGEIDRCVILRCQYLIEIYHVDPAVPDIVLICWWNFPLKSTGFKSCFLRQLLFSPLDHTLTYLNLGERIITPICAECGQMQRIRQRT
jgi:hypothetical protein